MEKQDQDQNVVKETAAKYHIAPDGKRYTYADYANWETEDKWGVRDRYELIDGVAYMMSAPSQAHQEISGEIFRQLANFLKGHTCKVFIASFDVCLNGAGDQDDTVVQPDLLIVCDKSKLDGKRCNGAPDMVLETLSPSNRKHDAVRKFDKYLRAGIREYWMVDPDAKTVQVCILKDGKYDTKDYSAADTVPVQVLDGCMIDLREVFAE